MRVRVLLAVALALAASPAARAQEGQPAGDLPPQPLVGSGLTLSGAPTIQELQAQQKACEARKPPRKAKGAISESLYKRMERIQDQISKGDNAGAVTKLNELNESARSEYEKAIVLQTLAFVYAQENKLGPAIAAFKQALVQNALPQQVHEQMMFNIAQLYMQDGKMDQGTDAMNEYLAESCNPLPDAHVLLAAGYAEKKKFREAVKQVDLALVKSKQPKEAWLQVKLAAHWELKEIPRCAEVLVFLVAMAPQKETYWKQLHAVLFEIKKDPEALAVLALAERKGYLNEEGEIRNLANMYLYMGIPLKAGQIMQKAFDAKQLENSEKNLELLANAWLAARENDKAEAALKKAAAVSSKGDLYRQLCYVYAEKMDWKSSLEACEQGLRKGGIKEPGEVQLLIAQAAIELHQWKRAEDAVRGAMQHEKTAKLASEWLVHVQQEEEYAARKQAEKEEKKSEDKKSEDKKPDEKQAQTPSG